MSSEWKTYLFHELCDITRGASPRPIHDFLGNEGMPWIKIADATAEQSRFMQSTKERIKLNGVRASVEVFPGDLILSNSATPGLPKFLKINACIHDGWMLLRNFKNLDKEFAYWLLLTERTRLVAQGNGSVFTNLKTDILKNHPVTIPTIAIQRTIALTLNTIDDRIALLRETNGTLEAIAQALFKSWFVDFEPVHAKAQGIAPEGLDEATAALFPDSFEESDLGLVPKGWRASTMDEVSVVGIGKTPPRKEPQWFSENAADVRWVSIRDMGVSGAFISQTSEYLTAESIDRFNVRQVPNNTVLLSFKMTIGRVALTDGEMTTNEAIAHFKLEDQSPLTSEFIYLHLKQFDYATLSSTSSIADAVNSKTVKAIPILVPDAAVVLVFQDSVRPIFERIKLIQQQAQILVTLRDTLLPRLISGQLRIPDVEGVTL